MFQNTPAANPVEIKYGPYHTLAEAIRRGSKMAPEQIKFRMIRINDRSQIAGACALGASLVAENLLETLSGSDNGVYAKIKNHFKVSDSILRNIECWNDCYSWSREEIANKLCLDGGCYHEGVQRKVNDRL